MQRLLVDQKNITEIKVDEVPDVALKPGEARLAIRRFALTANNVTYASSGFAIGYWHFFPTGIEGQGIVPVWGFAEVTESQSDVLAVGERLYGFWPMAEELIMVPQDIGGKGILDAAPHRETLPAVYNRYVRSAEKSEQDEGFQSLLQPLLATSFLLSDWLQDNDFFGAEQVIVGSASSKTGLGLCKFLSECEGNPVRVIGLTSGGNAGFVASQSGADQVVTYDAIETLSRVPSVYVDMAGNADVKQRLHTHLADVLKHSSAVGTSHWDQFRSKQELDGVKPQFFFAPSQIEKRRADWGPGEIERQITAGWKRLAANAGAWLDLRPHAGLVAAASAYQLLAAGQANPRDGHVVTL